MAVATRIADPVLGWLQGGDLLDHEFQGPLQTLRVYAQARRAAIDSGFRPPDAPFPNNVRASLFCTMTNREVDHALGFQERRVEAA
eukprot:15438868-Alexandrium_andersonii.AAC.1